MNLPLWWFTKKHTWGFCSHRFCWRYWTYQYRCGRHQNDP